ncbi:MAG: hypothetical protein NTY99_03485 [DPANN group archaeon]|nr:hypothetical protein [DPANN group archaeon]
MKEKTALKAILAVSVAGLLFSGYLSYTELFAGFCGAAKLGMGTCTNVFQIPACVYGFFMYLAVFVISLLGLISKKK